MKKKRWLSLLLCLLLLAGMGFSWLPVQSSADTSITPVVCASTVDGQTVYANCFGIPLNEDGYFVLVPTQFYQGENLAYLVWLGGEWASMQYFGTAYGYAQMRVQTSRSGYFYSGFANARKGGDYTVVGCAADGSVIRRSVTITEVGSKNSDKMYPLTLDGNLDGMYAPAAIVQDNQLVGIVGEDGAAAFAVSRGVLGGNKIIIAAAAVAVVLLLILLLRKKNGTANQSAASASGVPDVPYTPPVPPVPPVPHTPSGPSPHTPNGTGFRLYLEATSGPNIGQMWQITERGLLLGRSPEANILYPPDTRGVSRKHCKVFFTGGGLTIMDLGSTSGTFIRGKGKLLPNAPVQLQAGDIIYLGSKKVALRLVSKS